MFHLEAISITESKFIIVYHVSAASGGSIVVEHTTSNHDIEGSNAVCWNQGVNDVGKK
jgi:hypothetical protein